MEDTLTSFKTAKLAKQKGFYIEGASFDTKKGSSITLAQYDMTDEEYRKALLDVYYNIGSFDYYPKDLVIIVSLSLLQKWLREAKGINIIPPLYFSDYGYACVIIRQEKQKFYKSYDEALDNELYNKLKELPDYIYE